MFKRSNGNYEIDIEAKFTIYKQDEQHLSDEDLFKYLNDFKPREKYLNKLIPLNGVIEITLNEAPTYMPSNYRSLPFYS